MGTRISEHDAVHTPFGKGTVREVRKNGRIVVQVRERTLVLAEAEVSPIEERPRRGHKTASETAPAGKTVRATPSTRRPARSSGPTQRTSVEVDLHGLTVQEALARVEQALNDALLADRSELRVIHGRSGGRIRQALHERLLEISAVRSFRIDPRNEGITIVEL